MRSFYIGDDFQEDDSSDGDLAILVMGGELDYEVSPQIRARLVGAIKDGRRRLVLDLSDVTFIDSTAIGVLAGTVVKLVQIFEITGLDSVIAVHSCRDEAVSALSFVR